LHGHTKRRSDFTPYLTGTSRTPRTLIRALAREFHEIQSESFQEIEEAQVSLKKIRRSQEDLPIDMRLTDSQQSLLHGYQNNSKKGGEILFIDMEPEKEEEIRIKRRNKSQKLMEEKITKISKKNTETGKRKRDEENFASVGKKRKNVNVEEILRENTVVSENTVESENMEGNMEDNVAENMEDNVSENIANDAEYSENLLQDTKKAVETTTENTEKNVGNYAKKNREIVGNEGEKVGKSVGKKTGKRDEELENLEEKNRKKTGKIAENNQKNVDENSQQSGFGLNSDPLASSELYGISLVDFIPVKKPHRFSSESPLPNWYGKKRRNDRK